MTKENTLEDEFLRVYREMVERDYPNMVALWPLFKDNNTHAYVWDGFCVLVLQDVGRLTTPKHHSIPEVLIPRLAGELSRGGKSALKRLISRSLNLTSRDFVVFINVTETATEGGYFVKFSQADLVEEALEAMEQHKTALGISNNKIFLSHKGVDKLLVRDYKSTLDLLGFDTWLDEDAMPAGTSLDRGISQGFRDSCAVVFFMTPNFKDEGYLETEIDYARREKREKGDKFQIITLVIGVGEQKIDIPELLKTYVYKFPGSDLEGLREIIRALPIRVGEVTWRT
jgi:hypothetical protein